MLLNLTVTKISNEHIEMCPRGIDSDTS